MTNETKDNSLDILMNSLNNFLEENRAYFWTELGIRLTNYKLDCKGLNNDR